MKSLNTLTGDALEQMIDYKVVDQTGAGIGTLHSLWSDPTTGAVEFLGVKTGWIFGHNHVVPAEKAELDDANNVVRLPYTEEFIKGAPSMSADAEISEVEEDGIFQYYNLPRRSSAETQSPSAIATADAYAPTPGTLAAGEEEELDATATFIGLPIKLKNTEAKDISITDRSEATANSYRLRKTVRPETASTFSDETAAENHPSIGGMVSPTSDDFINGGAASITTGVGSGATGPVDSEVSPTSALGDTGLSGSTGVADDIGGNTATTLTTGSEDYTDTDEKRVFGSTNPAENPDPITGEPGAHPLGTGAGAAGAGAAGAAIGAVIGGPIGAVVGGIAGAIGGGLAGKGVAESINPTEENQYWQENYRNSSYYEQGDEYSEYEPAYRVGYEGYSRHAASASGDFSSAESTLKTDYEHVRGTSKLDWEKAKHAAQDAWKRVSDKAASPSVADKI